jgi:radical SAM protein with 4Fe4S-binding SPASM domain
LKRKSLPADTEMMPIHSGVLLVSREWAVFCAVPGGEVSDVEKVLAGSMSCADLSEELTSELGRHGFFDKPRPAEEPRRVVQVQVTRECTFSCAYCCADAGCGSEDEITFEEALDMARQTRKVLGKGAQFSITGGEPFSLDWTIDLAEEAVDLGLKLTVFTTGILLTDRHLAERVAGLAKRGGDIRIGLPGPTREVCDRLSEGPRFEKALDGINLVGEFGGIVTIDLMLVPEYAELMEHNLADLRKRLPEGTKFTLNQTLAAGRERGQSSFASRAELEDILDRIAIRAGVAIPAPTIAPVVFRREACSCALGEQMHIRSDGAAFPCFRMEEQIGDLGTEDFAETLKRLRRTKHESSKLDPCRACALGTICGGGCRSENARLTGDPDQPVCGPWRVRVMAELLAEDRVNVVDWQAEHLLAEAHRRGIEVPKGMGGEESCKLKVKS